MNLEQYLNSTKEYEMNKINKLLSEQKTFFVFAYCPPFPLNEEYLTATLNNTLCGLIFTSKEIAEKCYPNLKDWNLKEFNLDKLEQVMKRCNTNSICVNYGSNWIILSLKEQ